MAIAIVLIIMFYILKAKPNGQGETNKQTRAQNLIWKVDVCVFCDIYNERVCFLAACCSGQVVKAVEAQTNKQEDKKDVPGETGCAHSTINDTNTVIIVWDVFFPLS